GTTSWPEVIPFQAALDCSTTDFLRVQNFAANVRVFTDVGVNTNYIIAIPASSWAINGNNVCETNLNRTFSDGTSNTIMFATKFGYAGNVGSFGNNTIISGWDQVIYPAATLTCAGAFFGFNPATAPPTADLTDGGWMLAPNMDQALGNSTLAKGCA